MKRKPQLKASVTARRPRASILPVMVLMLFAVLWSSQTKGLGQSKTIYRFDFGPGKVAHGYTQITQGDTYSKERSFGFEPGPTIVCLDRKGKDALRSDFCTSDKPFYFSVALPEGNYKVTVTLGDAEKETATTVKAELRRLMLEHVQTERGAFVTRSFTVNVRTPKITGSGAVTLKDREKTSEWWAWDEKLTLEFNDARACVNAIEISAIERVSTVYVLGDSTVADQSLEPYASWGQMLPRVEVQPLRAIL